MKTPKYLKGFSSSEQKVIRKYFRVIRARQRKKKQEKKKKFNNT